MPATDDTTLLAVRITTANHLAPKAHTITIDFILTLPTFSKGFDSAMSVTDIYSKQVTFSAGKIAWGAKEWATELLDQLNRVNCGLPSAIFSNRNRQFVAKFW